jgi:hypothetical protein
MVYRELRERAKEAGLNINVEKTKAMLQSRKRNIDCKGTGYRSGSSSSSSSSSSSGFYNPLAGFSLLILEVSRSHTVTQHSR